MNENQAKQNNLVETTDCLEAIGVLKGWKNFLFVIAICCLLLLQASFWLVDTGCVKTDNETGSGTPAAVLEAPEKINEPAKQVVVDTAEIKKAVEKVTAEPNRPAQATVQQPKQQVSPRFAIKFKHLAWLIRFLDFVLIPTAALYCLTMLFALKVSLLGRLGGINHICRAFFLSLTFFVLLLPWQRFFAGVVAGAIYTPQELLSRCAAVEADGIFTTTLYYLRFTGYWLLVMLLLILSQLRSYRWAKATLRRLEII